jgi:DNA-binding response OmpR family regulator
VFSVSGVEAQMKTVLVVDSDVGFVFWLGQGLDQNRYAVLPAANVRNARTLLDELGVTVDLVIVNPALPDAADFVGTLRGRNPRLKVVLVTVPTAEPAPIPSFDLQCQKPTVIDDSALQDLIAKIRKVLPPFVVINGDSAPD